ncbi:PC-esterase domain-containing protein 1A-like [Sparus aurata]|uniref:PC-esterase domain-containing protein 1A-like n=1 Tax=Sparus aurata TaxID=8175 RepID=UPI0011C1BDC3|nr:PC-esterase domain-containing protein 1A-like [Sparus aurata]XP_030285946.1 PC-esterase domain-containing protein 1A-like [Sparus aurata]XP_030285947.1 PC-esterase domain-containing protein 1A-like [Sparus aurata]
MRCVSHKQASQLLHNKFIVVLGDSIQRSVYKDLVLLLQREKHLTHEQLRSKGEMSFEQDCLVEGGCLSQMHNGTQYREVRQFRSDHHLVRFYFVTRVYSDYMQSILEDFRHGLKPDVVIVNSCVWDISRYSGWMETYKENLQKFFIELKETLPEETLVVWSLTMPLGEKIKGGFLVSEIEHKAPQLRNDVIEANFYSGTLGDFYGMDVLDLHFQFRFSLQHRTKDGVHWNALAHRRITFLLLQHIAEAWGVFMPSQLNAELPGVNDQQPSHRYAKKLAVHHSSRENYDCSQELYSASLPVSYLNVGNNLQPYHHKADGAYKPAPRHKFDDWLQHDFDRYEHHHRNVKRSRHTRHYAPYTHHRPSQHARHGYYN